MSRTAPSRDQIVNRISTAAERFRTIGGWVEWPRDLQRPLEGQASADVIVVGGGFAGLSTALELRAAGADVVLLESEFAGFGASGRNAGYLAGGQRLDYASFLKKLPREQVSRIVRYYEDGVGYVEGKLAQYGIDCDYLPTGVMSATVHPSQEKQLREQMALGVELGAPATFLDEAAMRARGIPPAFLSGWISEGGGTLHPGKYVTGLRRAALSAGIGLYEKSPLLGFSDGRTVICRTARGAVHAPHMVLATNAYTPRIGLLKNKVLPIRVSAIETETLTPEQVAGLGWPNREGIMTQHNIMESHRLTVQNTLVITTKRLHYVYGSKTPNIPDGKVYRDLAIALNDRFPTLRDVGIRSAWSGYISYAADSLPVVGETGARQNILYTAGCSGHGVGTQSFVGKLLADRIGGVEHPYWSALQHETPSTLPGPAQWLVTNSLFGAAHMLDEHTNRKVRRESA